MHTFAICLHLGLLVALTSPLPPLREKYPTLPEGYTDFSGPMELAWFTYIPHHVENGTPLTEDSILPYQITLPPRLEFCWGEKDTSRGSVCYACCPDYKYDDRVSGRSYPEGAIFILWQPHQNDNPTDDTVTSRLLYGSAAMGYYLSIEEQDPTEITISGKQASRLKGFYLIRGCSCHPQTRCIGAFTTYFILSQPYDYIIVCSNEIYRMEGPEVIPDSVYDYPEEVRDSVIANWDYEHTYPNRIAELERAVEQTFRVKE
ncbi:hypothetical protein KAX06_05785 [candidate division WOR-3 bacterium]|nr:hypothetical protein [candidate division WOR-3 bacterium]